MELLRAHGVAMAGFDRVAGQISDREWSASTPCREWTVRDLLNHLVYEQLWVPGLLGGASVEEIGSRFDGDVLGEDPIGRWRESSAAARGSWCEPGVLERQVRLGRGPVPAPSYGWEMTLDLAVHGWDLATGIGARSPLDEELAELLLEVFADQIDQWQGLGLFDTPIPVSPRADPATRLLALLGRST